MEAPFKKGQKVVYLDRLTGTKDALDALVKDNVYTVNCCDFSETGIGTTEWYIEVNENKGVLHIAENFAPITEQRERINYVAVSETLRETAVEIAAIETN